MSYFSPSGRYSYTSAYFAQERSSGFITGPATTNGRFTYGPDGGLPTSSLNATAYFVDAEIDFVGDDPGQIPAALVSASPAAGATNVNPSSASITATLTNAASASLGCHDRRFGGGRHVELQHVNRGRVVRADRRLARGTTYTITVTADGGSVQGGTWSFSTIPSPRSRPGRRPLRRRTSAPAPSCRPRSPTLPSASIALTRRARGRRDVELQQRDRGRVLRADARRSRGARPTRRRSPLTERAVRDGTWTFSTRSAPHDHGSDAGGFGDERRSGDRRRLRDARQRVDGDARRHVRRRGGRRNVELQRVDRCRDVHARPRPSSEPGRTPSPSRPTAPR